MSASVDNPHMYFNSGEQAPVVTDVTNDPNAIAQQNGYAVYYQQQAMPIQQYASFYPNQQYSHHVQQYAHPTPVASPTIDPTTGQPTVVTYAQGVAPHTPQSSPTPSPAPSRRSRGIQESGPYFRDTEQIQRIYSIDRARKLVVLLMFPKIDRGFFLADNDWTCYRRNYFQVSCSFTALDATGQRLDLPCFVQTEAGWWTVTQFMINVTAKTSTNTRDIELVQHTAKRDKGPQILPQPRPCDPQSTPVLNFRQDPESRAVVTFERLQFKSATANNGKRRAAQQYHLILLELFARCENGTIIKVAACESAPLVVRGRAPGHYAQINTSKSSSVGYDQSMFQPDLSNVQAAEALMANGTGMPQVLTSPGGSQVYSHYGNDMHYYQYQYPTQTQQYPYAAQHFTAADPNSWSYQRADEEVRAHDGTTDHIHAQHTDAVVNTYVTEVNTVEIEQSGHVPNLQPQSIPTASEQGGDAEDAHDD
ncbi:hypothetical protein HK096_006792, partial [Nowakowskiella sp. JEL0078]